MPTQEFGAIDLTTMAGSSFPFQKFIQLKKHLPQGIMQSFFAINVMLDLHSATELMMKTIGELQKVFPTSVHLKASRALVLYHMRGEVEDGRATRGIYC